VSAFHATEERGLIYFVVMMLMFDVASDDEFIDADGGSKISTGPEGMSFIETLLALDFLLDPGGRFPFDDLHGVGDRIAGSEEDTEMDMIGLDIEFDDFPVLPFADGLEYSP